jgi:hypothetical protein
VVYEGAESTEAVGNYLIKPQLAILHPGICEFVGTQRTLSLPYSQRVPPSLLITVRICNGWNAFVYDHIARVREALPICVGISCRTSTIYVGFPYTACYHSKLYLFKGRPISCHDGWLYFLRRPVVISA